ncbi:unnamed protein product [Arctia plantaginis]|uniref:Uncharacterized protein n=1 Tax=Arctia plantaginis TaxID=874455 RepID=A0A8S1AMQ3_ARCPL|nr:unnamed protein product [Arctia plantaginis]
MSLYPIKNLEPGPARRDSVFGNTTATYSTEHNDIIDGGTRVAGGAADFAGRMRGFDGQGRGRAILPRTAASLGWFFSRALFLVTTFEGQMRSKRRECSCVRDYKAV